MTAPIPRRLRDQRTEMTYEKRDGAAVGAAWRGGYKCGHDHARRDIASIETRSDPDQSGEDYLAGVVDTVQYMVPVLRQRIAAEQAPPIEAALQEWQFMQQYL